MRRLLLEILASAGLLGALACVGDLGGPDATPPRTPDADPSGIWVGTVTYGGSGGSYPATALVYGNRLHAYTTLDPFWVNTTGTVSVFQTSLSGTGTSYVGRGGTWGSTGTFNASATYSGSVATRGTLTLAVAQTGFSASYSLPFNGGLYDRPINLSVVAGAYASGSDSNSLAVGFDFILQPNGDLSGQGQSAAVGTFTGKMNATNPSTNLFQVSLTYTTAQGAAPFTGYGFFSESAGRPTNSEFTALLTSPGLDSMVLRMSR